MWTVYEMAPTPQLTTGVRFNLTIVGDTHVAAAPSCEGLAFTVSEVAPGGTSSSLALRDCLLESWLAGGFQRFVVDVLVVSSGQIFACVGSFSCSTAFAGYASC